MNTASIKHSFRIFQRHMQGTSILEMGPAEGVMTDLLVTTGSRLTAVEGAPEFCESLRARHPGVTVVNSLFEAFEPRERFDTIVMGHVLEHVEDPTDIIRRASQWLTPAGRIMAAVPNCRSVHRQAAVLMGLLPNEDALNEMDRHHGHRRVFSPESFRAAFRDAGVAIEVFGGYWLKPFSNRQLEQCCDQAMVDAFMALGERYPDIAGELYVIARLPEKQ
jgi:2-polyprenyl-3-methyl-5-hydroxy-6-metoxy-1,4-benzoquinol methylase